MSRRDKDVIDTIKRDLKMFILMGYGKMRFDTIESMVRGRYQGGTGVSVRRYVCKALDDLKIKYDDEYIYLDDAKVIILELDEDMLAQIKELLGRWDKIKNSVGITEFMNWSRKSATLLKNLISKIEVIECRK